MLIKAINEDKVKILVEEKDIGVFPDFKTLDYNNDDSREFILGLLKEVYTSTGINFLDGRVVIEALPGNAGAYYIVITRMSHDKTKPSKPDGDLYLFELCDLEKIFDAASVFSRFENLTVTETALYKFKNKYYLAVDFPPETVSDNKFYLLIKSLTEHFDKCKWNIINDAILKEWGELIIKDPIKYISD